jgi:hypothetical protein
MKKWKHRYNIKMFDAYVLSNKFSLKQVEKCPMGRPWKHVLQLLPNQEIKQEEQEEGQKNKQVE